MTDFKFKEKYNIDDLVEIIALLRSENGCPWDKVQTHESIRTNVIEEAYEVCEGIDSSSPEILREELGDLLMQVVFHTQLEREQQHFDFDDVCDEVCKKLIYRHPHVFGEVKADDAETVLKNWDALKKESKHQESYTETLSSVPKNFPALLRGEKLCKRAERAGLPIDNAEAAMQGISDKLKVLSSDNSQKERLMGSILLELCNLARILDIDAEKALTYASNRFIIDFGDIEANAAAKGMKLSELPDEELKQLAKNVFSGR